MLRRPMRPQRRGASILEAAIVLPLTFFLLFGLLVGSMGVFRYQQVASLAREGARWACVRGKQYEKETGKSAATASDIYNEVILKNKVNLDPNLLTTTVTWNSSNAPSEVINDYGKARTNTVSVTVTYQWIPEAIFGGATLTSTSVMEMAY